MWVPSLVGKLRSHMAGELSPSATTKTSVAKKKKNRKKNRSIQMINSEELKEVNRASKAWS